MSRLFGFINGIESHNKSRQLDSALENYWVTKCDRIKLCTTAAMETNIKNVRKKRYGLKR